MATAGPSTADPDFEYWKLAKYGVWLALNNRTTEAEELFKNYRENMQMNAGYALTIFLDALMSFEEDKVQLAGAILKDIEKKCTTNISYLKNQKNKVSAAQQQKNVLESLESQIILADTQVCLSILTFLQNDISGYLKGGWVLRKAWKIYHHTYGQIEKIYVKHFGQMNLPGPTDFNWVNVNGPSTGETTIIDNLCPPKPSACSVKNGYTPNLTHSQSSYALKNNPNRPSVKRSESISSSIFNTETVQGVSNSRSVYSFFAPVSSKLSYLSNTLSLFNLSEPNTEEIESIDPSCVVRLMGAVCFGFGMLQLGIALLPPAFVKIVSLFGFHGNRSSGLSRLMYARKGVDMRAPIATLALLWYHTIIRPFFGIDGSNIEGGSYEATKLLEETRNEFAESALFLFFEGRTQRMLRNIPLALKSFQSSVNNASHKEVRVLSLHEVGWCYLIQLDYDHSKETYLNLKDLSKWSKAYYSYLYLICAGSCNQITSYDMINELKLLLKNQNVKTVQQIELFLLRRVKCLPTNEDALKEKSDCYWRLLVYEVLYMWNNLPICTVEDLRQILRDCEAANQEPMPGLAMLMKGICHSILNEYDEAVSSLRSCLDIRSKKTTNLDDTHVSAYGECELGALLIKKEETATEGKNLLHHANSYRNYDFDNRLQVRIAILRKE